MSGNPTLKSALVIGGTRFFGLRLVKLLLAEKCRVTVLTRGNLLPDVLSETEFICCDRSDGDQLRRALRGKRFDVVFDQACFNPGDAQSLIDALGERTNRLVFTSTMSVYEKAGELREEDFDPYTLSLKTGSSEDFPFPEKYGEGKQQAEATYLQKYSVPSVAVRIPIVLGPDDYTKRLFGLVKSVWDETVIGCVSQTSETTLIHAQEAAEFLLWSAKQSFVGPINACSNGRVTIKGLLELISKITGKTPHTRETEENHNPFVGYDSKVLNTVRAKDLGFRFLDLDSWLPPLVETFANSLLSQRNKETFGEIR